MAAQEVSEAPEDGDGGLISRIRSEFGFIRGNFLVMVRARFFVDEPRKDEINGA